MFRIGFGVEGWDRGWGWGLGLQLGSISGIGVGVRGWDWGYGFGLGLTPSANLRPSPRCGRASVNWG